MNEQEAQYISELEQAYQQEASLNQQLKGQYGQSSMFSATTDTNLIEWQLELDNILERIDHLLRGDELGYDDKGNLIWKPPKDKNRIVFNEYGVQEILRVLSMYLNRNTILSNYDEQTINWKIYDFGMELSDLIFMKYEEMGLVTPEKIKLYPIMCRILVDTVHSAYLRALHGGERDSLRTARSVTQTEPLAQMGMQQGVQTQKKFSLFKPTTWGRT